MCPSSNTPFEPHFISFWLFRWEQMCSHHHVVRWPAITIYVSYAWLDVHLVEWSVWSTLYFFLAIGGDRCAAITTWSIGSLSGWATMTFYFYLALGGNRCAAITTWSIGSLSGWTTITFYFFLALGGNRCAAITTWSIGSLSGWTTITFYFFLAP
jgi:hypothetical protein